MTAAIIFSKNRAMQLDALLRSILLHVPWLNFRDVHILHTAEPSYSQAYAELCGQWPKANWHEQRDFDVDVRLLVKTIERAQICFLVDDDLFYGEAPEPKFEGGISFSFRLGKNITACYNKPEEPLADFTYLFSLDGNVYPVGLVRSWLDSVPAFATPNHMEALVNKGAGHVYRGLVAFADQSSLVNIPHNIVTSAWKNRSMGQSAAELNRLFLDGWRVDLPKTFSGMPGSRGMDVNAVHMEIPYRFRMKTGAAILDSSDPDLHITTPLFSICHATARLPFGWVDAFRQAFENADRCDRLEYILCVDQKSEQQLSETIAQSGDMSGREFKVVVNHGRPCAVDAWNAAAAAATGAILIDQQDDCFFPPHWDTELLKVIGDRDPLQEQFHVHVSRSDNDRILFGVRIYSRARYEHQSYSQCPEYESMFADDDITERAYKDGVVIEATHLMFEERHPVFRKGEWDEVYARENSPDRYRAGKETIERRRREFGFGPENLPVRGLDIRSLSWTEPGRVPLGRTPSGQLTTNAEKSHNTSSKRKHILFCLSGESFNRFWVIHWTQIMVQLFQKFDATPVFGYTTNVYLTRHEYLSDIKKVKPDYVVWMDDDNLVTADQIETLIVDLDENPELDGVAGWCKAAFTPPILSCGTLHREGWPQPFTEEGLMACDSDLISIDYTGFPLFVTRPDVYGKLGSFPFRAVCSDHFGHNGQAGEDISFCLRARRGSTTLHMDDKQTELVGRGLQFAVDRRVKVPHMKTGDLNGTVREKELVAVNAP
jgi:hypothetical protein